MIGSAAVATALKNVGENAQPGDVARAIRKALGISLKDLAAKISPDTHFTTIAKLETGKIRFNYEWAQAFALALSVPINIFYMPYEVSNIARLVPVYIVIEDALHRRSVAEDHYTAYLSPKENLFGVVVFAPADVQSETVMYTAIVDPDRTSLRDQEIYLFTDPVMPGGRVAMYKDDAGVARWVGWPSPLDGPHPFYKDGSRIHGQVVELQRTLVSRNC